MFKISDSEVDIYRWSRVNNFFQLSSTSFFAMGGGGHFALWVDEDLHFGSTAECSTFQNEPLTCPMPGTDAEGGKPTEFEIVVLEVWTAVPHGLVQ